MAWRVKWKQNTVEEPEQFDGMEHQLDFDTFWQAIRAVVGLVGAAVKTEEGVIIRAFPSSFGKV